MTSFPHHQVTLSQALQHITSGKALAIFVDTPELALIELEHTDIKNYDDNLRIIQVPLKLSVINEGINKTLAALAALAQSLLPEWELNNHEPGGAVNHRWRERAIGLCKEGKPPLPKGYSEAQTSRATYLVPKLGAVDHHPLSRTRRGRRDSTL